jgi:hypothetical protein
MLKCEVQLAEFYPTSTRATFRQVSLEQRPETLALRASLRSAAADSITRIVPHLDFGGTKD